MDHHFIYWAARRNLLRQNMHMHFFSSIICLFLSSTQNVIVSASCGYSHGGNDTMAATGGSVTVTVGSDGKATLTVPTLSAVAIHINAKAN